MFWLSENRCFKYNVISSYVLFVVNVYQPVQNFQGSDREDVKKLFAGQDKAENVSPIL